MTTRSFALAVDPTFCDPTTCGHREQIARTEAPKRTLMSPSALRSFRGVFVPSDSAWGPRPADPHPASALRSGAQV